MQIGECAIALKLCKKKKKMLLTVCQIVLPVEDCSSPLLCQQQATEVVAPYGQYMLQISYLLI